MEVPWQAAAVTLNTKEKYELGSECSCGCSGVTIWTILTVYFYI